MKVHTEMTGTVWKVLVAVGDEVTNGQTLMILESMKMEIPVDAPIGGKIVSVDVRAGEAITDGQLLAEIE